MTIELVRVGGRLIGRTVSDRWNLAVYGLDALRDDRNQSGVKRLRRLAARDGITVKVVKAPVVVFASGAEMEAFGGSVPAYLDAA